MTDSKMKSSCARGDEYDIREMEMIPYINPGKLGTYEKKTCKH